MKATSFYSALLPALLFLTGCNDHYVVRPRDLPSWYKVAPNYDYEATMVPSDRLFPLSDLLLPEAFRALADISVLELTSTQLKHFLPDAQVVLEPDYKAFLVRAGRFKNRAQAFSGYLRKDGALVVYAATMGNHAAKAENYAVIVLLKSPPTDVYPAFHMAE